MALEVQWTDEMAEEQRIKTLVLGEPGAGKTLMASTFPAPVWLAAEPGLLSLRRRRIPTVKIASSEDIKQAILGLRQDAPVRQGIFKASVETVVLDTVDELQRIIIKERLREEHKEALAQGDWGWLQDQMRTYMRALWNLDLNVVVISHIKESRDEESGHISYRPQLQGGYTDEITQVPDVVGVLKAFPITRVVGDHTERGVGRILQTYPDASYSWAKDRTGALEPEFPINFEDDYERMAKAIFADGSKQSVPAADKPAAAPQPPVADKPATQRGKAKVAEKPPKAEAAAVVEGTPEPSTTGQATLEEQPAGTDAAPEETPAKEPEEQPTEQPATDVPIGIPNAEPEAEAVDEPADDSGPDMTCEGCAGQIEDADQLDLSVFRFRKKLCRKCFRGSTTTAKAS